MSKPTHGVIYALCDPRTNEVRYIGKTIQPPKRRLKAHLVPVYLKERTRKNAWIKAVLTAGARPTIEVLETCLIDGLDEAEIFNIAYWKFIGARLTNGTDGGDGGRGIVYTPEMRLRRSLSHIGNRPSDEARLNMRLAQLGKKRGPYKEEHGIAISRGRGGRAFVDDTGVVYETAGIAARMLGVDESSINKVLRGKRKRAGGRHFRYTGD